MMHYDCVWMWYKSVVNELRNITMTTIADSGHKASLGKGKQLKHAYKNNNNKNKNKTSQAPCNWARAEH